MQTHQLKSLLNGKTGVDLLITNQVNVSKKHNSADVVTICMLLLQLGMPANTLCVEGSIPSPPRADSSAGRATTPEAQVRLLLRL